MIPLAVLGGTLVGFPALGGPLGLFLTAFDVTSPALQSTRRLAKRFFKVINPVWYSIHRFLEEMSIPQENSFNLGDKPSGGAIAQCMRAMYYRNCTKPADESLVLSSLLSSRPESAAKLDAVEPSQRMKVLFQKLSQVPVELLFVDQARYEELGSRWIPKSFLAVNAHPDSKPIRRTEKIRSKSLVLTRKQSLLCNVKDRGLEVGLDGLRFHPQPCSIRAPFRFRSKEAYFQVHVRRPGTGERPVPFGEAEWVLIPEPSFIIMPLRCEAILVKVLKKFPLRSGGVTEFAALATMYQRESSAYQNSPLPSVDLRPHAKQRLFTRDAIDDISQVVQKMSIEAIKPDDMWIVG